MNPTKITTRPAFTVIGLLYRGDNKNNEIPQLWEELFPDRAAEIQNKVNPHIAYGVEDNFDHEAGVFDYLAGYEVTPEAETPAGMVRWDVPEQTYAVFKCTLPQIREAYDTAYNQWLPDSGYKRAPGPEFELYNEEFIPPMGKFDLYLYVPVEKRDD